MKKIEVGKGFEFKPGGEELAKVLIHYGLIPDAASTTYKIVCPFHNDKNPSMIVDLNAGTYYCFGCTEHGNAYDFVKKLNSDYDDITCLKHYFNILKSKETEHIKVHSGKLKPRQESKEKLNEAMDYFFGLKTIDWEEDVQYETLESLDYMLQRGFNEKVLNEINAKITYNKNYPIVFPMMDNGVFRGWVCRTNDPIIAKKRKYLYNEGFSRATTLVGNYSYKCIPVICEGYMDHLKLRMFGIKNVVAILGWKITNEQVRKLKDLGITKVISALDNDECGIRGTNYLKNFFEVVRWQYDSNIKDAGDMNKDDFNRMHKKTIKELRRKNHGTH